MDVRDAEVWQLVDERLDEVRRLPSEELRRRARAEPEVEVLERASGAFRRRTRVVALPRDRLGIKVRVDVVGRRRPAEAGIVITSSGAPAPEWSRRGEPPRGNPFAFGPRATLAGVAPAVVLLLVFFLLAAGCGEEERRVPGTPDPAHASEVARNPYALNCGDLARQPEHPESQKLVIRAEFALAREPVLRKRVAEMTLNRAGRSVYWALTEICKGRDPSFRPARAAVEAVRRGEYLVQPRPKAWERP